MLEGAGRRRAAAELHERHLRALDLDPADPAPRVSVVIPTLTEALNLPFVLPHLPDWIDELIIVDGHSTDDTVAVAQELWPGVQIVYQDGRGKGNALACGLAACSGDIAVLLDADGSTDPGEIPAFVEAIVGGAQLAKGSRFLDGAGSDDLTALRRAGNAVLTWLVNRFFGTRYSDLCYGFNAIRLDCVDVLALDVQGFEIETLIGIRAAKEGLAVVEVPSWERSRIHGQSNLRTFRGADTRPDDVGRLSRRRYRANDTRVRPRPDRPVGRELVTRFCCPRLGFGDRLPHSSESAEFGRWRC
jgi:glycosyltransferase involved in cell wall biosynthesis